MKLKDLSLKSVLLKFLLVGVLTFIVIKAHHAGYDANVYLHASQQFFTGEDIYSNNPYNDYLYSPLFTVFLGPISGLDFSIARIFLVLINAFGAFRIWRITRGALADKFKIGKKAFTWWVLGIIIISVGFLIHNLNLGQINVLILWLTLEGLHQILNKNRNLGGAGLLALGINIKIIPIIGLYYLFFKGKYRALFLTGGFVVVSLFAPAVFHGFSHNMKLLENWKNKINPSNTKYVFENNNRCNSLNAILPAYFYDYVEDGDDDKFDLPRVIAPVSEKNLEYVLQGMRLIMAASILYLIFYKRKNRENNSLYFFWEFSYLMLISFLIFPHQMKYALVNIIPAAAYLILFAIHVIKNSSTVTKKDKAIAYSSLGILLLIALMGRDILGNHLINLLDYYHALGIITLLIMVLLPMVKPDRFTEIIKG